MASNDPVILTLLLDKESFAFFEKLRRLHFPEERNFLQAHLTLFHHLPPEHYQQLLQDIAAICKQQQALQLQVREVKMMGRGVAYRIESDRLMQMHLSLQKKWQQWLMAQDKQKLWPHVTVQNKVSADEAKLLYKKLEAVFTPFASVGLGLQLWAYKGGPWELLHTALFAG